MEKKHRRAPSFAGGAGVVGSDGRPMEGGIRSGGYVALSSEDLDGG